MTSESHRSPVNKLKMKFQIFILIFQLYLLFLLLPCLPYLWWIKIIRTRYRMDGECQTVVMVLEL